jgi:type IV pilus assembly protein PilA
MLRKNVKFHMAYARGFTLIELLVSIVIIGLLSAIALPSYLNQAGKARSSEAKSTIGTVNRSQQAYRFERGTFANSLADLDVQVTGKFYLYSIANINAGNYVATRSVPQGSGLTAISGGIAQVNDSFVQVICESETTVLLGTPAAVPTAANVQSESCPPGYVTRQ